MGQMTGDFSPQKKSIMRNLMDLIEISISIRTITIMVGTALTVGYPGYSCIVDEYV